MQYEFPKEHELVEEDWEYYFESSGKWRKVAPIYVGHTGDIEFHKRGWWRKPKRTNEATDWELVTDPDEIIQADWQFSSKNVPWKALDPNDYAIGLCVGGYTHLYWRRPKKYGQAQDIMVELEQSHKDDEPQRLMDFFFPKSKMSYYK